MLSAMDFVLHTELVVAAGQDGVTYAPPKMIGFQNDRLGAI